MALTRTGERLRQYLWIARRAQDSTASGDPVEGLRTILGDRPWVLFAGAGLSCDPPASAPTFSHLRNAAGVAVSQRLVDLGILSAADAGAIEKGLVEVDRRDDISLPPEKLFDDIGEALGNEFVHSLLEHSLRAGTPNANHLAIAALARGSLEAVITPNFDEYLEEALAGEPLHRIVCTRDFGGTGLRLYKPHGSLDSAQDIQISVMDMASPLAGRAREIFGNFVKNRPVVVFGYSGQDRDLFPLLLHAGREWGTEIVWLLFDRNSRNEAVAGLQVSLGERCTVLDTDRRPILAELAHIEPLQCIDAPDMSLSHLTLLVKDDLVPKRPEDLIAAILSNILPTEVAGGQAIAGRLADVLLSRAESMPKDDARTVLSYVGLAEAYLPNGPRRELARRLGLELAIQWGSPAAIRAWGAKARGEPPPDPAEDRFLNVVRQLEDLRDTPAETMSRMRKFQSSVEVGLLIERTLCLWDIGREEEAETETRRLIVEAPWPKSPMDAAVAVTGDACEPWRLYCALARFEAKKMRFDLADEHLLAALELLWREPDLWSLGDALCSKVFTLAQRVADRELQRLALDLALELARLSNDKNAEEVTLKWRRRLP
jgi:hypothetical protein